MSEPRGDPFAVFLPSVDALRRSLNAALTGPCLVLKDKDYKSVRRQIMDLVFIGAIIAFWAISFGMAIGCDKLRRTSHHRE
ncbi:hypothetical protein [Burkholderia sp. S171]|uniref:hypothetical protein n=1 Tax=Burkholderia sp. S171 TaxID=1641860 RepID=UPI00131EBDC4|nr:hypothetical protein [Burkholderia sp. S171]